MNAPITYITRDEAAVLRLFIAGKSDRDIADLTTLDLRKVTIITGTVAGGSRDHAARLVDAYNKRTAPTPEQGPSPQAPAASLILRAASSKNARIRTLGKRLEALTDDLSAALAAEAAREKARAAESEKVIAARRRVDQAAAALAEAKAALNAVTSQKARPKLTTAAQQPQAPTADSQAIRRWAAEADVPCPPKGRVPRSVAEAFAKAHSTSDRSS